MTTALFRNATMSVLEAIATTLTLFLVFRLVVTHLGVASLGAWSLVAATLSVSQIADIGLGGALQRFVPAALARGSARDAIKYVETSVVSTGVLYFLLVTLGGPLFSYILASSVSGHDKTIVLRILPYSLISFFLSNMSLVFQSGLAGVQRYDLRSAISIGGSVAQLISAALLIPSLGLVGLVCAQILQNVLVLICTCLILRRNLPGLSLVPLGFSISHFKEMIGYGVNLQFFFLASFLFEPATKLILTNLAGLSWVGYYELGTRVSRQVRNLVVSMSQVLVPTLALVHEQNQADSFAIYKRASDLTWLLAWPIMSLLAALIPSIGRLWFGHADYRFDLVALTLTVGWTFNLVAAPSYFMALATNRLRWNLVGWALVSLINVVVGLIFGLQFGGIGVIFAAASALAVGSIIMQFGNHVQFGGNFKQLINRPAIIVATASATGAALVLVAFEPTEAALGFPTAVIGCLAIAALVAAVSLTTHPAAAAALQYAQRLIAPSPR